MQRKGIDGILPRDLFDMDFVKQCKVWIRNGEELCAMGDINDDVVRGAFTELLRQEGIEMEEFGNDFCEGKKIDSFIYGNGRIAGGWKTRGLEITQLMMFLLWKALEIIVLG